MPARVARGRSADWRALRGDALVAQLNAAADELQVTSSALRWRLVSPRACSTRPWRGRSAGGRAPPQRPPRGRRACRRRRCSRRRFVEIVARADRRGPRLDPQGRRACSASTVDDLGGSLRRARRRGALRAVRRCVARAGGGRFCVDTNVIIEAGASTRGGRSPAATGSRRWRTA